MSHKRREQHAVEAFARCWETTLPGDQSPTGYRSDCQFRAEKSGSVCVCRALADREDAVDAPGSSEANHARSLCEQARKRARPRELDHSPWADVRTCEVVGLGVILHSHSCSVRRWWRDGSKWPQRGSGHSSRCRHLGWSTAGTRSQLWILKRINKRGHRGVPRGCPVGLTTKLCFCINMKVSLAVKDAPGPVMCPDRTHAVRSPCLPNHTVCICTSL